MDKIYAAHYTIQNEEGNEIGELSFESASILVIEPKEVIRLVYPLLEILGSKRFLLGIETLDQNNQRIDYFGVTVDVENAKVVNYLID